MSTQGGNVKGQGGYVPVSEKLLSAVARSVLSKDEFDDVPDPFGVYTLGWGPTPPIAVSHVQLPWAL